MAKVAPKMVNVGARKPGAGMGDEERAELLNEVGFHSPAECVLCLGKDGCKKAPPQPPLLLLFRWRC